MGNIKLDEFLREIENLLNEKKEFEAKIDTKINTLAGAAVIMCPGENVSEKLKLLNYSIGSSDVNVPSVIESHVNDYSAMSSKQVIRAVLAINTEWITEEQLIKDLRAGRNTRPPTTIKSDLSRMRTSGEIEKDIKNGVNYFRSNLEWKKTDSKTSNYLTKRKKNPILTNACVKIIKKNPTLDKEQILNKLIEKKFKFDKKTVTMDAKLKAVGNALNSQLKRGIIKADKGEKGKNIYSYIEKN